MTPINESEKWQSLTRIERLGELLVRFHVLKLSQLTELIEEQKNAPGLKLGELAVQKGLITKEELLKFLETQLKEGKVVDESLKELGHMTTEEKWNRLSQHERLGELLLKKKVLKLSELTQAMEELHHTPGKYLGELLVEKGLISETELNEVLAWQGKMSNVVENTIKEIKPSN